MHSSKQRRVNRLRRLPALAPAESLRSSGWQPAGIMHRSLTNHATAHCVFLKLPAKRTLRGTVRVPSTSNSARMLLAIVQYKVAAAEPTSSRMVPGTQSITGACRTCNKGRYILAAGLRSAAGCSAPVQSTAVAQSSLRVHCQSPGEYATCEGSKGAFVVDRTAAAYYATDQGRQRCVTAHCNSLLLHLHTNTRRLVMDV